LIKQAVSHKNHSLRRVEIKAFIINLRDYKTLSSLRRAVLLCIKFQRAP
jgi:hypothetical protein